MCVTHPGRARLRAGGGSGSQSTRFLLGLPVAADRCHGLACAASDPRLSPRGPSPPTALPSRSAGLSGRFGTASYQIRFAVLEKNTAQTLHSCALFDAISIFM